MMLFNLIKKYQFTLLYIILTSISANFIYNLGIKIPDSLMISLSSFYALLFFHLLNYNKIFNIYQRLLNHKIIYIKLLIAFLGMWGFSFILPIYFSPSLTIFFAMSWPALLSILSLYYQTRLHKYIFFSLILLMLIIFFYIVLYKQYNLTSYILLVLGMTILGISMYAYSKISFKLSKLGFSSSEILAVRFWLLFLIPLIITCKTGSIKLITNPYILISNLILSIISLIIPVFCNQKSIINIGVNKHSLLVGFTPIVTTIIEFISIRNLHALSNLTLIFSALFASVLIIMQFKTSSK